MNNHRQIGIDIGARFTDVVSFQPDSGTLAEAKVRSRRDDPVDGLPAALSAAVMPPAAGQLDRLEAYRPAGSRLHLLHSAAAMAAPEVHREQPPGLAFSGPAGGAGAIERGRTDRLGAFAVCGTARRWRLNDVCSGKPVARRARPRFDSAMATVSS